MHPEFAKAVDPVFLSCLDFLARVEQNFPVVAGDERANLVKRIDNAEIMLGATQEWKLAKYALCAWVDSMMINSPWNGAGWWKDNCLEVKYFGRRDAHEEFFRKALEAGELGRKDALEVFYIAVVLGFRGLYGDSDVGYAQGVARNLRIPDNVEAWCRGVARSLQLRQGRPEIPGSIQAGGAAKPLTGRATVIMFSMISTLLAALAISCYVVLFVLGR